MKKSNIPKDPMLGLAQLQIWAQLDSALILEHLKKGTSFSNEAISKGQIFSV